MWNFGEILDDGGQREATFPRCKFAVFFLHFLKENLYVFYHVGHCVVEDNVFDDVFCLCK